MKNHEYGHGPIYAVFSLLNKNDDWLALLNTEIRSPKVKLPLVQFGSNMCWFLF